MLMSRLRTTAAVTAAMSMGVIGCTETPSSPQVIEQNASIATIGDCAPYEQDIFAELLYIQEDGETDFDYYDRVMDRVVGVGEEFTIGAAACSSETLIIDSFGIIGSEVQHVTVEGEITVDNSYIDETTCAISGVFGYMAVYEDGYAEFEPQFTDDNKQLIEVICPRS